ncbi:OmpP1/FadL family transporter [Legionella spiritensis]|uniref:OmpP1/FadL family transporter n=1 Tax=Legionella spiritensis TaxID=452 RepID=UPI001EE74A74|nr:outer membrane protein transport protein [Legionella spiritensis]
MFIRICFLVTWLSLWQHAFCANGQVFDGINYINPANNLFVKKLRVSTGSIIYNPKIPFQGTVNGNPKKATSNPLVVSPYARVIYRLHPKLAFGLAISEPYRVIIDYKLSKDNIPGLYNRENIRTASIHPNLAIQLSKNLWLGAGLNIVRYQLELNLVVPFTISSTPTIFNLQGNDVAWSYALGAIYLFNKNTFLDVAYFSRNTGKITGTSSFKNVSAPTLSQTLLVIPDTLTAALTHRFDEKLMVRLGVMRTFWQEFKYTSISLPNAFIPIPLNYRNTNRFLFLSRYQLSNEYAFSFYATKDFTPTKLGESNFALAGNIFSTGFIASKKITKSFTLRGLFGYGFNTNTVKIDEETFKTFGTIKNKIIFSNFQIIYNLDG